MSDAEIDQNLYDSDQDVAKHHSKLVDAVARLDKRQRVKKAERSEPSLEISEYHLVKSGVTDKDAVRVQDLIKSLGRKGDQSNIIKRLKYIQKKNRVLPTPLEKPAAERIKRTVGYDKVKDELKKWDAIVSRNRTAERLSFPLKRPAAVKNSGISDIPKFLKGFSTKSDLWKKFEEVNPALLYPAVEEKEEDNKYKMTMEEMILKRKEAARLRAQQSYKEAKAHRQHKIKSKKFHRIQRKNKIKQQLKDFEKLKDSNPQEALAKLEQLDKTRAEERMSLRHKNTGQWAKNKQIRAKYNKETRQVLAEQLAISKELTQKVKRTDSDEEDEEYMEHGEDKEDEALSKNNEEDNIKTESEIDDFIKFCRKYYDKKQQTKGEKINESSGEIILEKEKETSHRDEKSNTSQANTNGTKSKSRDNEKNSTSQANASPTKSKLRDNKKSSISQENASPVKSKLRDNEKSSISEANASPAKSKLRDNEKSSPSQANASATKGKVRGKKKNSILKTNITKSNSPCNHVDAMSVARHVENETRENKQDNKKSKSQDTNETSDPKKSKEKKLKRKLNLKEQKVKKKFKTNSKVEKREENEEKQEKENEDYSPSLEFEDPKRKPILDSPLEETTSRENVQKDSNLKSLKTIANAVQEPADLSQEVEIDPTKYVNVKPKHLKTQLPDMATGGDEDSEQEERTHRIMSEAFADDDVVEEFRKEKEEEMKKLQPQQIDLSLPGWGSWGGPNVKKNKVARKRSRFILTIPKVVPRKPENQGKVIVFENENERLKKHLVKELPHPFTRVQDFEASIRAPVSRSFVPMNAHLRLIQPTVNTKLGQVIEPMDENELVKNQPTVKKPLKDIKEKNDKKKKNIIKKNITKKKNKKRGKQNVRNI